ncbi:hypothetical protein BGW80DRAFT_1454440 [Lactifluus volemus]|nr:hypothetical protein BGW80DRAFT_1454440 [Lactifluus volemus]
MSYFTDDSEQCVSWKKLQGPPTKEDFTTEILGLAAQYEALRVWGECVKSQGALESEQAKSLVYESLCRAFPPFYQVLIKFRETIVAAWIVLQVGKHMGLGTNVDHKTAESEGK